MDPDQTGDAQADLDPFWLKAAYFCRPPRIESTTADNQHSFRARRSCETQLMGFINDLAKASQKYQTDVAIMDFSKAFDVVHHEKRCRVDDTNSVSVVDEKGRSTEPEDVQDLQQYDASRSEAQPIFPRRNETENSEMTGGTQRSISEGILGSTHQSQSAYKTQNTLSFEEGMKLVSAYFPVITKKVHNFYLCQNNGCHHISSEEETRLKSEKMNKTKTEKQKKKTLDIFHHKWLVEKDSSFCEETGIWWLIYVECEGMYCLLCRIHNARNKFNKHSTFNLEPSTSGKHSAVSDHAKKNDTHKRTFQLEMERRNSSLAADYEQAKESRDNVTFNVFQGCYWLAKEEVANRKLQSLVGFQKRSGVKEMVHWKNTSERSQKDMRFLIGQLVKDKLLREVNSAKWYSILVDEVTDCATLEQLLIYVGYVDAKGEAHFRFLDCIDVLKQSHSPDAATITQCIVDELQACNLNFDNLCGFGSDGASVMTGRKNGVGPRLQLLAKSMLRIHCISHRLALALGDANDNVKYVTVVERTLRQLWKWLDYPKRASAFVKVCTSLHEGEVNNSKKLATKIQKACRTRWLSTGQSISSVCRNFVAVMQTLRIFKEEDATAHGLLSRMNNVKFLGAIILLDAILPQLNKLSKLFQKDHTCYASVRPDLECTKQAIQNVREDFDIVADLESKIQADGVYASLELEMSAQHPVRQFLVNFKASYTHALEENLDRRFTEAPVLKAFSVFDPTQLPNKTDRNFATYGQADICLLSEHFHFDKDEVAAQWNNFKYHLSDFKIPDDVLKGKDISPTHYILKKLVREQSSYRIGFSGVVDLAQICLTQPLSNAVVERGASAVKRVKTRLRNSIKNDMFASLLHITINGPDQGSQAASDMLTEATSIWRRTHSKNLPKLHHLPKVGGSDHNTHNVETSESSVQTESDPLETAINLEAPEDVEVSKIVDNIIFRAFEDEDPGDFSDDSDSDF